MKRQRRSTTLYALEARRNDGQALSTEEEEEDTPDESDSESEQALLASRRKSPKKSKKKAQDETSDSDDQSEASAPPSEPKVQLPAVSSLVPSTSAIDHSLPTSIITFQEMADYAKSKCISWKSDIDYSKEIILLYRLAIDNPIPTVTRSVQIRLVPRESGAASFLAQKRIIANICIGKTQLNSTFVTSAIKKAEIWTEEDIGQLLKHVEQLSEHPAKTLRAPPVHSSSVNSTSWPLSKAFSVQPVQHAPSLWLRNHATTAKMPRQVAVPCGGVLQAICADLHREKCRNMLLFNTTTNNPHSGFRLNLGSKPSTKLQLLSEKVAERSPSPDRDDTYSPGEDTAEDNNVTDNRNDGPSLSSSLTGWESGIEPQESEGEPEPFYWREAGENRAKVAPHDLYISGWYLQYLKRTYGLLTSQRRTMAQAIYYGWDLICHMLGGPAVICRRLTDAQNDQAKTASALLGADIHQIVVEHVKHSFFSRKERATDPFSPQVFGEAMDKKIFELPSSQQAHEYSKKIAEVASKAKRQMSDSDSDNTDSEDEAVKRRQAMYNEGRMCDIHCQNTCTAPGRVLLTPKHPHYYIDHAKLEELQRLHGLGTSHRKVQRAVAWYGYKIAEYWLGGEEQIRRARKGLSKGTNGIMRMAGKKLFQVVLDHCYEKYPTDPPVDAKMFKSYCCGFCKHTAVRDEQSSSRNALASVLFVTDVSEQVAPATDAPSSPHVKYWSTAHPSRIQLHPDHAAFYVDTVGIAEYQRYYGPQSGLGEAAFVEYTFLAFQHLVGGEEVLLTQLRQHTGQAVAWLDTDDKAFLKAYCEHVVHLFPAAHLSEKTVRDSIERQLKSRLILIGKGKGRLPKGVLYADGSIPPQVRLLDEQEYWRTPAPERTQLRTGHDVYISTAFLQTVQASFGPASKNATGKKYAYAILEHMLGGMDVIHTQARNDYVFWQAVRSMMRIDHVLALCLHTDEAFHLTECLPPDKLFLFSRQKIEDKRRNRSDRRQRYLKKYAS